MEKNNIRVGLAQCSKKMKKKRETNFLAQCSNKKFTSDSKVCCRNLYICLAITESEVDNVVWYKINPNISMDEQIPSISSVCSIPHSQVGSGFRPAFIGTKLYIIGGGQSRIVRGSKDVYCIDTQGNQTLVPRKLQTDTLAARQGSAVVSTHGKIYVFGSKWLKPEPWGEYFDRSRNQWFPLPQPPNQLLNVNENATIFHAVVGDTILLSYEDILASFHVKTNSWDLLSNPLTDSEYWDDGSATLDDVLFMYRNASVVAYDLVAHKWFEEPVRGLELACMSFLDPIALSQGNVVHLGDKNLCVIWHDLAAGGGCPDFCVRCVKFRVSRIYDTEKREEVLQAEVQARSAYRIRSGGNYLLNCFPM